MQTFYPDHGDPAGESPLFLARYYAIGAQCEDNIRSVDFTVERYSSKANRTRFCICNRDSYTLTNQFRSLHSISLRFVRALQSRFVARPITRSINMPHILIVDDEPIQRMVVREALGYDPSLTFCEAETGAEVIDCARAERPDLIILDIQMPEQDGFAAYRQLKTDQMLKSIPILLLTATYKPEKLVHALDPSAVLITKPFDLDEFQAAVRELLNGTRV
jgi:CheY-like chemotaxis protein